MGLTLTVSYGLGQHLPLSKTVVVSPMSCTGGRAIIVIKRIPDSVLNIYEAFCTATRGTCCEHCLLVDMHDCILLWKGNYLQNTLIWTSKKCEKQEK